MTYPLLKSRATLALMTTLCGLSVAAVTTGPRYAITVSAWTCVEIAVALLTTSLVGVGAIFATSRRSAHLVDLAVSRGLEMTAALPIVLVCAVAVVTFGWRMPYAVALVTGALNGLTCLRMVTLEKGKSPNTRSLVRFERALVASVSELVPQLVGLEAAIEFLGLFNLPWEGGIGKPLGTAVTNCNLAGILAWSLLCVGLSVGTQLLLHRRQSNSAPFALPTDGNA
jgi:hypothetical protein